MRMSDWSSDVCSSDLDVVGAAQGHTMVAGLVEDFDCARRDVDAFDPPARIVARDAVRRQIAVRLDIMKAAVVAAIQLAIGRASCRERVCQYLLISVVAGSLKKKQ